MSDEQQSPREVDYPSEFRIAATELVEQSSRILRIFSPDLNPDVYSAEIFVKAVSSMVRSNRRSEARIIVLPGAALTSRAHGLLTLCRQLPSLCQIRILDEMPDRFREDFVLSDRQGMLARKAREENTALYDPEDRAGTAERIEHFDQLWNRSTESPEFRQLTI